MSSSSITDDLWLRTADGLNRIEKELAKSIPWISKRLDQDGSGTSEDKPIQLPEVVTNDALDSIHSYLDIAMLEDDFGGSTTEVGIVRLSLKENKPKELLEFALATHVLEMDKAFESAFSCIKEIIAKTKSAEVLCTKFGFSEVPEEEFVRMKKSSTDARITKDILGKLEQGRNKLLKKEIERQEKKKVKENPHEKDARSVEAITNDIEGDSGTSTQGGKKDKERQEGGKGKKQKNKKRGKQSTKNGTQGGTQESPNSGSDDLPSIRYVINYDNIKNNIGEVPTENVEPSEANIEMVPVETLYEGIILRRILELTLAWNGNQFSAIRKKLLRDLISIIARFERANKKEGNLTLDNIEMVDYKTRILPLIEKNREEGTKMPSYRMQLRDLLPKILGLSPEQESKLSYHTALELLHFQSMFEFDSTTDEFEQLQYHPFLLTSNERSNFINHSMLELAYSKYEDWKDDYRRNSCYRIVDIKATIASHLFTDDQGNMHMDAEGVDDIQKNIPNVDEDRIVKMCCGFKELFDDINYGPYAVDVVGAFQYSRNLVNHINRYMPGNELTAEELDGMLSFFFPEQLFELYRLLVDRGIDLNFMHEKPTPIF